MPFNDQWKGSDMDKASVKPEKSGSISTRQRQLTGIPAHLVRWIAVGMSLFQLYTGYFQFTAMNQRVPHVTLGFILIFLVYPIHKKSRKDRLSIDSMTAAAIVLICGLYVMFTWFRKMGAMSFRCCPGSALCPLWRNNAWRLCS